MGPQVFLGLKFQDQNVTVFLRPWFPQKLGSRFLFIFVSPYS